MRTVAGVALSFVKRVKHSKRLDSRDIIDFNQKAVWRKEFPQDGVFTNNIVFCHVPVLRVIKDDEVQERWRGIYLTIL